MKRKGLVKKAVLPALVALVCSVIALTSVSYAWFTIGNEAQVDDIQMNVQAADGLQISATGNAGDFKSTLDTSELKKNGTPSTNKLPGESQTYDPVSTVATITNGQLTFYKSAGEVKNGVLTKAAGDTTNYICFDIYVQASNAKKLYLKSTSTVDSGKDGEKNIDTDLASRVAFIDLGSASTASEAQALTGDGATVVIWEPNSTVRSQAYKNATGDETATKKNYQGISTIDSNGVPSLADVPTSDNTTNLAICSLEAGYNRIRVYIWLEGQDVDCLNDISGHGFTINLDFLYAE